MYRFYDPKSPPPPRIRWLTTPPSRSVQILTPPSANVTVWLHMIDRRSVPCRFDKCPYCPQPIVLHSYAYAVAGLWTGEDFKPRDHGILPITMSCLNLALEDHRNKIIHVYRQGKSSRALMRWKILREGQVVRGTHFNLLDFMLNEWAIREKILAHELLEVQPQMVDGSDANLKMLDEGIVEVPPGRSSDEEL